MITPYHNNRCTAITKSGTICKNLKNYNNNYCNIHNKYHSFVYVLDINNNNEIYYNIENINDIIKNSFLYYTNIENFRNNIKYKCNIKKIPDSILNIIYDYINPKIDNNIYITKIFNNSLFYYYYKTINKYKNIKYIIYHNYNFNYVGKLIFNNKSNNIILKYLQNNKRYIHILHNYLNNYINKHINNNVLNYNNSKDINIKLIYNIDGKYNLMNEESKYYIYIIIKDNINILYSGYEKKKIEKFKNIIRSKFISKNLINKILKLIIDLLNLIIDVQ